MKDFSGKVLVITGAGSGIGAAIAREGAARGMKVVANDIDPQGLAHVVKTIRDAGGEISPFVGDASLAEQIKAMYDFTLSTYGQADVLVNNAGVAVPGPVWEIPIQDIDWITETNLSGHAYGFHYFIPHMIERGTECAVINVASAAGIFPGSAFNMYYPTKAGDVFLAEGTSLVLQARGITNIQMHVLCPAYIKTTIHLSENHRPERYQDKSDPYYQGDEYLAGCIRGEQGVISGIDIDSVGQTVFTALEENQFYIFTHPEIAMAAVKRASNIANNINPSL